MYQVTGILLGKRLEARSNPKYLHWLFSVDAEQRSAYKGLGMYTVFPNPLIFVFRNNDVHTITVRTIDTTASDPGFTIVEKTVWHYANGGRWSNTGSIETLIMGGSGTSGVHNYNVWCDAVTDLEPGDTGLKIHAQYYIAGPRKDDWIQLAEVRKTSKQGTTVNVKFVTQEGNNLVVHITIS
ncbi:Cytolysin/lectin [Suillus cothurnatus]|nr:Cytolysin/lectin [Suillus cothurnatus]